jgi:hypothetical protein
VIERLSDDRVSFLKAASSLMHIAYSTHPDYATLVDPLFAARKEGRRFFFHPINAFCFGLSAFSF